MIKKHLFLILAFLPLVSFAQKKKNILFIGNSYTGVNNLPQLFADVSASAGDTIQIMSFTPGGQTLMNHAAPGGAPMNEIAKGIYDVVVLQEQSQLPSFPDQDVNEFYFPYVHVLDSAIKAANKCSKTMLYMTWGRKNGDAMNCASWPPVCTYLGMDSLLRKRTLEASTQNQCDVSPVGAAWRYSIKHYPWINLYQPDESHPDPKGSYIAACVFYTSIFKKDPSNIKYNFGIDPLLADTLRNIAKSSVFEHMDELHVGYSAPKAAFYHNFEKEGKFLFVNESTQTDSIVWHFGDGDTSHLNRLVHTYLQSGKYKVTLEAHNHCGEFDTASDSVFYDASTGLTLPHKFSQHFYPNPFSENKVQLLVSDAFVMNIYNRLGQAIQFTAVQCDDKIEIEFEEDLPKGTYYCLFEQNGKHFAINITKL
ncbi:MAG TPA: PKD domain-containing protein [Bacteroidia bacterium]